MRILITGATGLVGTELIALLLQHQISIHYLTVSKSKDKDQPNCTGFFWNPEQGVIDDNCLIGVDAIIHLAGANISNRWTDAYKQEIIESRVLSSNTLYKALKENPNQVKQIVSASAVAIYPNSSSIMYTEDEQTIDHSFLGNVVLKWEESVDKFKRLNIQVCKLRTGIVLSAKGGALPEMLKPIKLGFGAAFGNGSQMQSWIHIHDLARMYFFAVQNSWEGVYNAVSPHAISNELLTKLIAKKLKKPLFMPNIPEFVMKLILGEMHELLFTDKNISPQKAIDHGFSFQFPEAEHALNQILS